MAPPSETSLRERLGSRPSMSMSVIDASLNPDTALSPRSSRHVDADAIAASAASMIRADGHTCPMASGSTVPAFVPSSVGIGD